MDGRAMGITIVTWLINAVRAYLIAGLIFSVPFVFFGIQRVDADAHGWKNIGFRIMIIPGMCVFWPLFAVRLVRGKQRPTERNAHRVGASQAASLGPSAQGDVL
ncbi:MAG: hypothetical protein F6K30_13305 [Cyanothece sp. SIO2G6]|nr:hypothetical protein [Cyanothece sp. SIO2G6]